MIKQKSASKKFLAFDLGASNGRAVVGIFNKGRLTLDEIHRFPNEYITIHGSIYWDILRLFNEIKRGLALYVKKYGPDLNGVGIDTWGVDFALLDRNGNLIGNPYTYRDKRTQGVVEEITRLIDKYQIYKTTGAQLVPISTLCQLYSLAKNNFQQLETAVKLLMMPGILNYFLTGEKFDEYTIFTPTCLYDIKKNDLSRTFLDKLNIPVKIMPQIVEPGTVIGTILPAILEEVGLRNVSVIAPATHDTASATVAVPAVYGEDWAFLSSGTWSVLGIENTQPLLSPESYELNITNAGTAGKKFISVINVTGLWLLEESKKKWHKQGKELNYSQMIGLAQKANSATAFINPDDNIFLNPINMPEAIIEYCRKTGQKVPEDKGTIIRVIFESLALKYKENLDKIEKLTGKKIKFLHIVGGGAQNKFLNQLIADITGKTVTAGPVEATAIGNIIMQAVAMGDINSINEARKIVNESFRIEIYSSLSRIESRNKDDQKKTC